MWETYPTGKVFVNAITFKQNNTLERTELYLMVS